MANTIQRATGSTGNAATDGMTRAGWVAAVQAVLAFSVLHWAWATADELALLEIPITFIAVALWGAFDHFLRPRLPSA